MCKCSHLNCQFEQLINTKINREIFYFEDKENVDSYCIFHAPQKIKVNFRLSQKELFREIIDRYFIHSTFNEKNLNFSNVTFIDGDFKDRNISGLDIDFTNAIFIENARFDNLKCKKLILKDTQFLNGGGIKNRKEDKNLYIQELEFRPYALHSDFVIDIGAYVNDDGLLEFDKRGVLENIRFENHQVGDGRVFFIGLNEYVQKADFTNMVLDKVFFQNCDLHNCYFLNAKIAKTEFRNCYFPQNGNRMFNYDIFGRVNSLIFLLVFPLFSYTGYSFFNDEAFQNDPDNINSIFLLVVPFYILLLLASLNLWIEFFSYWLRIKLFDDNEGNIKSFHVHYCIADERKIYEDLTKYSKIKDKNRLESNTEQLKKTLDSLSSSYSQLKENFTETDFQVSGDFFYSQRYTEILAHHKRNYFDLLIYNVHQFTNGFGESYIKPFIWFVLTLVLFVFPCTPNQDYVSTSATPLFLIKDANTSDKSTTLLYIKDKNETKNSFYNNLTVFNYDESNKSNLYGYDNRYNYHIQKQYILALDENKSSQIKLMHSFSNIIYPFTPEQKRWFQNVSDRAVYFSLIESILLWYFGIAFVLALWHRIKR